MTDGKLWAEIRQEINEAWEHAAQERKQRWCEYYCMLWYYGRGSNASLAML